MSLIVPPWYFANETDSLAGVTPYILPGLAITPGTSNADGTAITLLSALSHDVHYLVVGISGMSVSAAAHYCLLDILIDPAGGTSWSSGFIDDLVCGFGAQSSITVSMSHWYYFPVFVKSGSSLGARARTSHSSATTTGTIMAWAYGNPSSPQSWWCGSGVETVGVTPSTSTGTTVTPGNSGSFGSWTNIGSVTSRRFGALQFGTNGTDSTSAAEAYHFQVGCGNNKVPGSPTLWAALNVNENGGTINRSPIWCDIPGGTQMQLRGTCSGTAENWNLAIYGVY